jgi:hypothetical protein
VRNIGESRLEWRLHSRNPMQVTIAASQNDPPWCEATPLPWPVPFGGADDGQPSGWMARGEPCAGVPKGISRRAARLGTRAVSVMVVLAALVMPGSLVGTAYDQVRPAVRQIARLTVQTVDAAADTAALLVVEVVQAIK